ncbi:hypothetical protein MRX96_042449 [Rhipicephalus microplus]
MRQVLAVIHGAPQLPIGLFFFTVGELHESSGTDDRVNDDVAEVEIGVPFPTAEAPDIKRARDRYVARQSADERRRAFGDGR